MRKYFCDFCGNEIKEHEVKELTISEGFNSFEYETCSWCLGILYKILDCKVHDKNNTILPIDEEVEQ